MVELTETQLVFLPSVPVLFRALAKALSKHSSSSPTRVVQAQPSLFHKAPMLSK